MKLENELKIHAIETTKKLDDIVVKQIANVGASLIHELGMKKIKDRITNWRNRFIQF